MKTSWPNFSKEELACQHCGNTNPNPEFIELMDEIQKMREILGFPLPITSGYRCPNHELEEAKLDGPGAHSRAAVDIHVYGERAHKLLKLALERGFTGIGINQKGKHKNRFIHLDKEGVARMWTY